MRRVLGFFQFWYDFVVGDDWQVAAGVAVALVATYVVSRHTEHDWWIVPLAVVVLLPYSLWRAVRRARR